MAVFDIEELKEDLEELDNIEDTSVSDKVGIDVTQTVQPESFINEALANSFFLARPDKVELAEQVLDPDAYPGLESIRLEEMDDSQIIPGLLANGYTEMGAVTKFLRTSQGLSELYQAAKDTNEHLYSEIFHRSFTLVNPDWNPSPNVLLCNINVVGPMISNYLSFFAIGKSNKELKKFNVPNNFKLDGNYNISKLAPIYIKHIEHNKATIRCIPLDGNNELVDVNLLMIKELKAGSKDQVLRYFEDIKKVEEELYRQLDPYLSKFKTGLKRLGSTDFKGRTKAWGSGGALAGIGAGAVTGAEAGAILGSAGGPLGAILGGVVGGITGAIGGGVVGSAVGTAAGAIVHPIIKGVSSVLLDHREKLINECTKNLLDTYDIAINAKEEIKKVVKA